jgi:hypothetical protein
MSLRCPNCCVRISGGIGEGQENGDFDVFDE